jgi:hypothetical protein
VARSILGPMPNLGRSRLLACVSFQAYFETKMLRRPAKIADFGIVLPSGVEECPIEFLHAPRIRGIKMGFTPSGGLSLVQGRSLTVS